MADARFLSFSAVFLLGARVKRAKLGARVSQMQGSPNRPRKTALVALGFLLFGVAVLEALVLPSVHRARAVVAVDTTGTPEGPVEPIRLARRLEEVTFDTGLLRELARARGAGDGALAAWSLRHAVRIASEDGRTFEVSLTDPSAERAQELCNLVAERVVARAPQVFRDTSTVAAAQILATATRPSWPTSQQGLLLLLGAVAALVASSMAAGWRALLFRGARVGVESEALYGVSPAVAPPAVAPPAMVNPAATLPLGQRAPVLANPPAPEPREPEQPVPQVALTAVARSDEPALRTDPMLPPPTPVAVAAAAKAPEPGHTFVGAGAQPAPISLRRSTLILGSPIAPVAPTPLPPKPTPTSIFRPSPLPPAPGATSPSAHPPGPPAETVWSSRPPPASASKSPSAHPLDPSGARYSYVSTPVPARFDSGAELRDVSTELDPALQVDIHKGLRRQLFSLGVAQCFVTAVSSVGEARRDKARFAVELALCLAETGHARVLLVEADLGEPEIRGLLGVNLLDGESLTRQLSNHSDGARWSVLRCKDSLHALLQEEPAQAELVLGEQFRDCVIGLCRAYDFVVLNGPPSETGLAGGSFTGWVDGAILVARDETASGVEKAKAAFGLKQFLRVYTPGAAVR
jgi:Mrp family chromosome partitioning ATPase